MNTNTKEKSVAWKFHIASLLTYLQNKFCRLSAIMTRKKLTSLISVLTSSNIHLCLDLVFMILDFCISSAILLTLLLLLGVSCLTLVCILISQAFYSQILVPAKTLTSSAFRRVAALRSKQVECPLIRPSCLSRIKNRRPR